MVGTPPVPEALARWLLSTEAEGTPSPDAWRAAAERVHVRLREGLSVFLGPTGFDSLWARAMHLARPTPLAPADAGGDGSTALLPGWPAWARPRDASEAHDVLLAALASFITLLFTFVGAALGARLIRRVWPDLPLGEAGTQTGEPAL